MQILVFNVLVEVMGVLCQNVCVPAPCAIKVKQSTRGATVNKKRKLGPDYLMTRRFGHREVSTLAGNAFNGFQLAANFMSAIVALFGLENR